MASGVYAILCTTTGHRYVGSAEDLEIRWASHKTSLNRGSHQNKALQYAWTLFGETSFTFEVLEEVSSGLLTEREKHFVEKLAPEFNLAPVAARPLTKEKKVVTTVRLGSGTSSTLKSFCHALSKTQTEVVEEALHDYFAKWNFNPRRYVLTTHNNKLVLLEKSGQDTKVLAIEDRNGVPLSQLQDSYAKKYKAPIELELEGDYIP